MSRVAAMMRGPCLLCRRPMNWIAADDSCLAVCRYCLGYLVTVGRADPMYAARLVNTANAQAHLRGDPERIARLETRR